MWIGNVIAIGSSRGLAPSSPPDVPTPWISPTAKPYSVLDTLANGKYNTFPDLAQNPTNKNKVILTYLEGVDHSYDDTKVLKMRVSNDKGQTYGAVSTIYDPGGILCVQEQHAGYTSNGRLHILVTNIDDVNACSLIYLYSDNDGVSFTVTDISALVADATYSLYRNSGGLIENAGVLLAGFYANDASNTTHRRYVLRLVSGTWTKVTVDTTAANENEMTIAALGGDNLILLVRTDVAGTQGYSFIQHQSSDNGLTWTRLGVTGNFGMGDPDWAWPSKLCSFQMRGEKIIVHYFPRGGNAVSPYPERPLYAVYARASDLISNGIAGWNNSTIRVIAVGVEGVYTNIVHGSCLHYNNNYNAIACWPRYPADMSYGDLDTFEIPTLDIDWLDATLFGETYSGDVDAIKFINNAGITNATQQTILQTLVTGLKTDSLWAKIKAAFPMIGGTAFTHKFDLVNVYNRLAFVNGAGTGWIHSATGAKPDGTGAYADTHFIPSTGLTLYSAGLGYYSRTNVSETTLDMGSFVSDGVNNPGCVLRIRLASDDKSRFYNNNAYSATDVATGAVDTDSRGFIFGTRTSNVLNKLFKNGAQSGTTNTTTAHTATSSFSIYIGACNVSGTATGFTSKESAGNVITDGLDDTEAANLYTRIQTFQTALSRQV